MRDLSQNGLDLIKSFEGLSLKAYKVSSSEKYYTIGYGHYGEDVGESDKITQKKAEELLKSDCTKAIANVNSYMHIYNFTQNEFDALVSFAFNIGSINQLTASGTRTKEEIAEKMLLYVKCGGMVLNGLVKRRKKEHDLFLTSSDTKKTNEQIALEVVKGLWGNGSERKKKLASAGYNYAEVQKIVNKLLK